MPRVRFLPAAAALLIFVGSPIGIQADESSPPVAEPPPGELLVASAAIQDPRFQHSVVLLLRHDATGAFGIVINRPIAERPLAELLAAVGDKDGKGGTDSQDGKDGAVEGAIRVFRGGPVQPNLGFVVHSPD